LADDYLADGRPPLPAAVSVEEYNDACFVVKDGGGQKLGFFYFRG
jgi:hypothetical protein